MKILLENGIEDYKNNLYEFDGMISFENGKLLDIDSKVSYIVPGFIDQHIHGAGDIDTMDNNLDSLYELSNFITSEGTTTFFPTTMTYDVDVIKEVLEKIDYCRNNYKTGAKIAGANLEGPFISKDYIGAQNPQYVLEPDINVLENLNCNGVIKLLTYAPENDQDFTFTKYCKENGIIASVGHSGDTCTHVTNAMKYGLANVTHLHNACSAHHHRTPGVVTAAFMNRDLKSELICDGIHIHPDVVKTTYNIKGAENIILVTDAMRAKGVKDGEYDLGGQVVVKKGNEARLLNGALAGSVLLMNNAVKNFHEFSECSLEEAFNSASKVVANLHKLDRVGIIKKGYYCDVVALDSEFNVVQTFVNGTEVYKRR